MILQRELYPRLVKGAYSIMAGGSIMVLIGGCFKALWKLLYALNVCDYVLLDHSFFPLQGPGFLLFFLGLTGIFWKGRETKVFAAPTVVTTTLPFIFMQIVGLGGAEILLAVIGAQKKRSIPVLFILAFVFMLAMGYLGAKFDGSSSMHWVAQLTNILSMDFFLLGTLELSKVWKAEAAAV